MQNPDGAKVRYSVDGSYYDIPTEKVEDFEKSMPQARQVYRVGDETFAIPLDKREGFAAQYPDAELWNGGYANPDYKPQQAQTEEAQPAEKPNFWARLAKNLSGAESSPQGMPAPQPQPQPQQPEPVAAEEPNEGDANFDATYDAYTHVINSRLAAKSQALAERSQEREGRMGRWLSSIYNAGQAEGGAVVPQAREEIAQGGDPEADQLRAASQLFDGAKKLKDAATQKKGLLSGLADSFSVDTWDFGVTDMKTAQQVYSLAQKLEAGEELSENDNLLLEAMVQNAYANETYGSQLKRGYKAGQVTGESLPFMLEFLLNPLAGGSEAASGGAVKVLERRLAKEIAKRGARGAEKTLLEKGGELAMKGVARAADDLVSAAGMAATTGSVRTLGDAYSRKTGYVQYNEDEDGNLTFGGFTGAEKEWWRAAAKAYGATTIEDFSEMFGNYFRPIGQAAGKVAGRVATSNLGKKLGLGKVKNFIDNVGTAEWVKALDDFTERTDWNGVLGEFGEEIVGGVMNALTVGDQTLDPSDPNGVFNPENLIDTFLGVAVFGGFVSSLKTAGYRPASQRNETMRERTAEQGASVLGDKWEGIQKQIDESGEDGIGEMLVQVSMPDSGYTKEEKEAIMDYARVRLERLGMEKGQQKKEEYIEEGVEEGRNATSPEDINRLEMDAEYAREKAERESERGVEPSGEAEIGVEHANAVMRGRKDAMRDGITQQIGQEFWTRGMVDDQETDMVHSLTYPDGREVFFISDDGGMFATIDSNGEKGFMNAEQIAEATERDGALDASMTLDQYLDRRIGAQNSQAEQTRMAQDAANNLAAVQQRTQEEGRVNIGTPESELWAPVVEMTQAGVAVQVEGEELPRVLPWSDVAKSFRMPLEPKTNQDIVSARLSAEDEVNRYNKTIAPGARLDVPLVGLEEGETASYQFVRAENVDGDVIIKAYDPDLEQEIDLVPSMISNMDAALGNVAASTVDVQGNPVPEAAAESTPVQIFDDPAANELGISEDYAYTTKKGQTVVDGSKLWAENPTLWAEWNDRNPNRVISTKDYLSGKLADIEKDVNNARKALEDEVKGSQNPDRIEELQESLSNKINRQQEVQSLLSKYDAAEQAAVEAAQQQAEAAAPVAEEAAPVEETSAQPQQEPLAEMVSPDVANAPASAEAAVEDAQKTLDELGRQMAVAESQEERDQIMEAKAVVLQQMFDALGAQNTVVSTMATLFDDMQRLGASQRELQEVQDELAYCRAKRFTMEGFYCWGADTIFMVADGLPTAEFANRINIHEAKHRENRFDGANMVALTTGVTRGEMVSVMRQYKQTDFYDKKPSDYLADEVLAVGAEIAEDEGVDAIPERLRELGVTNEDFINFVKNNIEDGRRRDGQRQHYAARNALQHENPQDGGGYDAGSGRGQSGDLGGSGIRSSQTGDGSRGEAGSGEPAAEPAPAGESGAVEEPAAETPAEEEITREITANIGGSMEGKDGNVPVNFSVSAGAEGVGLTANESDEAGNVTFVMRDGRVFDGHHPLTVEDVKNEPNTVMGYMMADALKYGTITPEQADIIWQKYTDTLNRMLEKGLAENGGFDNLSSQWQWVGETVFKTVSTNSDDQYKFSLDITRVCKKNEAVINAISAVQRRLGYGITPGQVMDIYMSGIEEGYQVPCPVCYVFSRYISNGIYATIAINGQKKYGKKLVDPSTLTEKQREAKVKMWQKELEKLEERDKKYQKQISSAKDEVGRIFARIDEIGRKLPGMSAKEKAEAQKEIKALDKRYKAALNLISQSSLSQWIKNFAIHEVNGETVLYEDSFQGFPPEYALDLRLTADTIRKYPAIQRLRKSGGSAAGKEIHFAANNDMGDVLMMLGASNLKKAPNYYQEAVKEEDPTAQKALLKKASEQFRRAMVYAQQQSLRGGQRMWSWSDNIERLAPDVFFNLMQLQMLGGALQSYSKQLEGANLVANMGGYVNGSLMGHGKGYQEVTDADIEEVDGEMVLKADITDTVTEKTPEGDVQRTRVLAEAGSPIYEQGGKRYVLLFDDVVGIDAHGREENGKRMKGLFWLNKTLDKAGNILVGMNDIHVRAAMADKRVFFIIPWHASGLAGHLLRQMMGYLGVNTARFKAQDYTDVQEEKVVGKEGKPITPELHDFWEAHKNETDFACGIDGGIPSGEGENLSEQQIRYKSLRDAIFTGVKVDGKTVPVSEIPEMMAAINADAFLSQVYRKVQERVVDGDMTSGDTKYIYPYEYWDEGSTYDTADINGARYLEYCRRLGVKPKFVGKLGYKTGEDFGNFADDKGYWKLLIDRRMYDTKGNFQDLTPVTTDNYNPDMVDPEKTGEEFHVTRVADEEGVERMADRMLATEKARTGSLATVDYGMTLEQAAEKYEEAWLTKTQKKALAFVNGTQVEDEEEEEPSIRPSVSGRDQEYLDAVQAGDMEKAQRMVRNAAAAAMPNTKAVDKDGKPTLLFHGTRSPYFTEFAKPGEDLQGLIWTTPNRRYAGYYNASDRSIYEGEPNGFVGIYNLYANIENPLNIGNIEDVVGSVQWDKIAKAFRMTPQELFERLSSGGSYEASVRQQDYIYDFTRGEEFAQLLAEHGYDGVFAIEDGVDRVPTIGLLNPGQVKSADPVTYDNDGNIIPLSERFNPDNDDIRFSLRGPIGALQDADAMANLTVAKNMEADGKDAKSIWAATGWEKGADGEWRNEIPDAKPKMIGDVKDVKTLGDIVDAPELFESYPSLKKIKVEIKKISGAGGYLPSKKTIELDHDYCFSRTIREEDKEKATREANEFMKDGTWRSYRDIDKFKRSLEKKYGVLELDEAGKGTLLHEMQHAIQEIEGFAKGGNTATMRQEYLGVVRKQHPELVDFARVFSARNSATKLKTVGKNRLVTKMEEAIPSMEGEAKDRLQGLRDYMGNLPDSEYNRFVTDADRLWKGSDRIGKELYRRLAGEVEARNVERRSGWSEEERRATPPSASEDYARSDQGVRFSVREGEPPKKTGIGYKVFYQKDGKLYPPMVANAGGVDTPVGVWLDAEAAPIVGESKTGRPKVKQGGKGTQGGSGTLAYRPGWHLGEIPYALQFNRVNPETGKKELFPKDFVWAEVEYAMDNDYQQEAEAEGMTEGGKFRHSYAGLKRVPENGYYRYRTNPNPETDPWIITGAMKVNRILTNEEVDDLVRAAGREPQQREVEPPRFSVTAEQDREYMDAVKNGNLQRAQEMVDEAAERAFPNSKVRGADGKLKKVYHGTGASFTVFDRPGFAYENGLGSGFYFTDDPKVAALYAMPGFMDNEDKIVDTMIGILIDEYDIDADEASEIARGGKESEYYEPAYGRAKEMLFPDPRVISAYINIERPVDVEAEDKKGKIWYAEDKIAEGADGVIDNTFSKTYTRLFDRIADEFKPSSEFSQYMVVSPEQIKSADPVTFDDNGHVIPLSERFNPENNDIRFSVAYHGTGADFERFDHSHMGEGEGAQAYGWGTYVTTNKDTGITYAKHMGGDTDRNEELIQRWSEELQSPDITPERKEMLEKSIAERQAEIDAVIGNRHLYTVEIPDDNGENYLHWDEPITRRQARKIMDLIRREADKEEFGDMFEYELQSSLGPGTYGSRVEGGLDYFLGNLYDYATDKNPGAERNAKLLNSVGIIGMQIPIDRMGDGRYEGSNYVLFDENNVRITDHVRFSVANANQEMFVSNAQRAVENIRQEKATPEQWLKMVEKNGGLKAGEDKWLGLSDWLKGQSKPVTFDDYFDRTKVEWKNVDAGIALPAWNKEYSKKGEVHYSPYRDSVSRYAIDKENGKIYRFSDHWGNVGSCVWTIDHENEFPEEVREKARRESWNNTSIGVADIKDFKRLPLTKQDILDYIEENKIRIEEVHYAEAAEKDDADAIDSYQKEYLALVDEGEEKGEYNAFQYAYEQMIERYGEDFGQAFYRDGNTITPSFDYYDDLTDAAKYFIDQRKATNIQGINPTRLDYTTDGLENKREIALTVPTIDPWNEDDKIHFGDAGEGRAVSWIRFGDANKPDEEAKAAYEEAARKLDEARNKLVEKYGARADEEGKKYFELATPEERAELDALKKDEGDKFKESVKSRSAKNVLFIDEIQSKRHQEGREQGYAEENPSTVLDGASLGKKVWIQGDTYLTRIVDKNGEAIGAIQPYEDGYFAILYRGPAASADAITGKYPSPEEAFDALGKLLADSKNKGKIPAAPFEKNWQELAMKRMLRLAAEEGYDYVAWTKGEQQAERYNIGNVVSGIDWDNDAFNKDQKAVHIDMVNDATYSCVIDREGNIITEERGVSNISGYEGKNISELVGKEIAVKIVSSEKGKLDGDNLRVGGEGMKGFYDEMLPRFMNKYGKQWGVKVEDITLPGLENGSLSAHAVPVTQEMKDSVMEGQLMFSVSEQEQADRQRLIDAAETGGLKAVIGEPAVQDIYRETLATVPQGALQSIVDRGMANGGDFIDQVRAYLNELALKGPENDESGLLFKLFDDVRYMSANSALTDADIRWMIWKETTDIADLLAMAQDRALRNRWGVGVEPAEQQFQQATEEAAQEATERVETAQKELKEEKKTLSGPVESIAKAMSAQKAYDRATVDSIVKAAKDMLKAGNVSALSRREVSRLLTLVGTSTGKSPKLTTRYADQLVETLLKHIVDEEEAKFMKLVKVKASKVNDSGVEVRGKLDIIGQAIIKEFRENMNSAVKDVKDRLVKISDNLDSKDDTVRRDAVAKYRALMLALQYKENIAESVEEYKELKDAFDEASVKLADLIGRKAYDEFIKQSRDALRKNMMERIDMYRDLGKQLTEIITGSAEAAAALRKADQERIDEIHHDASRDMEGTPKNEHLKENAWQRFLNSDFVRFFLKPLSTADQMFRLLGRKSVTGEGYLFTRYIKNGFIPASEKASKGFFEATEILDKKVSEVFGKKMKWSDLYKESRKKGGDVTFLDGGELKSHELSVGNMLYIYMADKMTDGKMKLRRMGISEEDVERIKKSIDPRLIELADWMQNEFYVNLRNKYNDVHERMFGAPMAAIEDYVPLKILANARFEDVDLGNNQNPDAMSSTITGSIIKRRRNSLALDILHTDAFSLAIEHIQQMEDWAAFAELRRDMNTLLSYQHFRNQVKNMETIYGTGDKLWKSFEDVCQVLVGKYQPRVRQGDTDSIALNVSKGVTAAKIAFRVNTAIKQILSFPAYLSDARVDFLAKSLATPGKSWKWCMENLPLFEKRWKSRIAGDTRLLDTDSDWKIWKDNVVKTASRLGMTPNAFVDATTVAIGAKAMYDTKRARYIKDGYSEEEADEMAKKDAEILYNQTQQSSENAFVSPVQLDRTVEAVTLTTYRNSSMAYQRQLHDAIRTLARMMKPGYRQRSIDFMTHQNENNGLEEEAAREAATRQYNRQYFRNLVRVAVFGYGLQFLWKIGNDMWYLLFGGDDDEKDKIIKEAALTELAGPVEGLLGGNVISDIRGKRVEKASNEEYGIKTSSFGQSSGLAKLPIESDTENILNRWDNDRPRAINDIIDLIVQSGIGVNPQTLTDAVVAIIDYENGNLDKSKEMALLMMRILQMPQSTVEKFLVDEIDMDAEPEARKEQINDLAKRYAMYKLLKNTTVANRMYEDGKREKKLESYEKQFKDAVKKRIAIKEVATGQEIPEAPEDFYKGFENRMKSFQTEYNRTDEKKDNDTLTRRVLEESPEFQEYLIWKRHQKGLNKLKNGIKNTKDENLKKKWEEELRDSIRVMINELNENK